MRYRVFGDTGGHFQQLYDGLIKAGMTHNYILPSDMKIIHCGDLIHKGKGSNEIVKMIDTIMQKNPNQWVQLFGNHESQYLGGITFWRDNSITTETVETLQRWYLEGRMSLAYGLDSGAVFEDDAAPIKKATRPVLFTHAGMTKDFWNHWFKHPRYKQAFNKNDVMDVVEVLNSLSIQEIGSSGVMLETDVLDAYSVPPSPIWAHCTVELWQSWLHHHNSLKSNEKNSIPFIQVHGHTSPFHFENNDWYQGTYLQYRKNSIVDFENNAVWTAMDEDTMHVAIDPGYEKTAPDKSQPFISMIADD